MDRLALNAVAASVVVRSGVLAAASAPPASAARARAGSSAVSRLLCRRPHPGPGRLPSPPDLSPAPAWRPIGSAVAVSFRSCVYQPAADFTVGSADELVPHRRLCRPAVCPFRLTEPPRPLSALLPPLASPLVYERSSCRSLHPPGLPEGTDGADPQKGREGSRQPPQSPVQSQVESHGRRGKVPRSFHYPEGRARQGTRRTRRDGAPAVAGLCRRRAHPS